MKMMENLETEVIYVRGNHYAFLDNLAPITFYNVKTVKDYTLESHGKKYYVTHGDIFDSITTKMRWIAKLGDAGYSFLLWLNKICNAQRLRRGKSYYSLSQVIKQKVKSAVSYISDFEKELVAFTRNKRCDGIICGHIRHPANIYYGNVHYLNSGDWVETMSALVEDREGIWTVVYYDDSYSEREKEPNVEEIFIAS